MDVCDITNMHAVREIKSSNIKFGFNQENNFIVRKRKVPLTFQEYENK